MTTPASYIPSGGAGTEPGDTKSGSTARQRLKSPAKRPFEMWLEKQLHAMFEIGSEPGPNVIDRKPREGSCRRRVSIHRSRTNLA